MMSKFFERYLSGDYAGVWTELLTLGGAVRTEPLFTEVRDVTREFVDRAFYNLLLLRARLIEIGYRFLDPDNALLEASNGQTNSIEAVEAGIGMLPILCHSWYERIAAVNFSQERGQLYGDEPDLHAINVSGLGLNCPLVFLSIRRCLMLREEQIEAHRRDGFPTGEIEHFLPFGGTASNNEPKGLVVPNTGLDGIFYNSGQNDVYFADELRNAFACGGFPFWNRLEGRQRRRALPIKTPPEYLKLRPLLTTGMKAL